MAEDLVKKAFEEAKDLLEAKRRARRRVISFFKKNSNLIKKLEVAHYNLINSTNYEIKLLCALELCSEGIAAWRREIHNFALNESNKEAVKKLTEELKELETKYKKLADLAANYFSTKKIEMYNFNLDEESFRASDLYQQTVQTYIKMLPDIKEVLQWTFGETTLFKGATVASEVPLEEEYAELLP